jgi:hypothetical protein
MHCQRNKISLALEDEKRQRGFKEVSMVSQQTD